MDFFIVCEMIKKLPIEHYYSQACTLAAILEVRLEFFYGHITMITKVIRSLGYYRTCNDSRCGIYDPDAQLLSADTIRPIIVRAHDESFDAEKLL